MSRDEQREQMRCYVERLLDSDLSVGEWCKRNNIPRQKMYYWLGQFAENEPDIFGGTQNIVDRQTRRWLESTRNNIAKSKALSTTRKPAQIVIVDSSESPESQSSQPHEPLHSSPASIHLNIKGVLISLPQGTPRQDIDNVVSVVAQL